MPDSKLETDFEPAFTRWKAKPGPDTNGEVLGAVEPVIRSALNAFAPGGGHVMRSRAKQIVLKALPGYDPTQSGMKPYLMSHLQGLRRLTAQQSSIISVPERVMLDLQHVHESHGRLADELGRDPNDAELADATGLSQRRLAHIRSAKVPVAEGRLSRVGDEGGPFSPAVAGSGDADLHWADVVYDSLDNVDRLIMDHSLGRNGREVLDNQALASKLRVSPSAVSQRKAKIQQKLNSRTELGVL